MSIRKSGTSFIGAVAVALAFVCAAGATAPTHENIGPIPYQFDVSCAPYGLPFSNQVNGEETLRIDTFYDASGAATKVVIHDSFRETDRNSVSGKTLTAAANRIDVSDLVLGTRTVAGRSFVMTSSGAGIVIHDTGRTVFDAPFHVSFSAGPHDVLFGDVDELACNALAG
jgi:hypothetical protein